MATNQNPLALHPLPWFITPPGETDILYVLATVTLILSVLLLGVSFFWLHSLPERMGHKKLQFEVVAVLGLISLFTHMHLFWIIGLLLALIDLPDLVTPLRRIANSAERIAGVEGSSAQSELAGAPAKTSVPKDPKAANQARGS